MAQPLQRATELIHGAASGALTLDSIAYVAGVSGRALQLAFRKEHGMTPMQYLKNVRLDRAAEALRKADPQGLTVGEVARNLGFTHMGHFLQPMQHDMVSFPLKHAYRRMYPLCKTHVTTFHQRLKLGEFSTTMYITDALQEIMSSTAGRLTKSSCYAYRNH